jgi:septal ring factor EnvC (AmiA/AmiB activator)
MPTAPASTPAARRLVMEEMCGILCRHDQDAQAVLKKYDVLNAKYRKAKQKLSDLRSHCAELTDEIDRSRQKLADHMNAVRHQEQTGIDEKLSRLEEMVGSQIEEQKRLIAEQNRAYISYSAARRSRFAPREPMPPRPPAGDDRALRRSPYESRKRHSSRH